MLQSPRQVSQSEHLLYIHREFPYALVALVLLGDREMCARHTQNCSVSMKLSQNTSDPVPHVFLNFFHAYLLYPIGPRFINFGLLVIHMFLLC